jgi:hypothetical protein
MRNIPFSDSQFAELTRLLQREPTAERLLALAARESDQDQDEPEDQDQEDADEGHFADEDEPADCWAGDELTASFSADPEPVYVPIELV